MAEVVDATKQEDSARMMGRYLLQAVQHAFGVVANDAIVDHVLCVQSGVPIAAILGQTVAEHHDGVGFHGRMGVKLGHALLVVWGGLEGFSCACVPQAVNKQMGASSKRMPGPAILVMMC